jgi:hypothetical protein
MMQGLSWKSNSYSAGQQICWFYEIQRFKTMLTKACKPETEAYSEPL